MSIAVAPRVSSTRQLLFIAGADRFPATRQPCSYVDQASQIRSPALDRIGSSATFAAGRAIFETGEPARNVFRVVHGVVRAVRLLSNGRRCVTNFFSADDYVALAEGEEHPYTLEAVTKAKLISYPRRAFNAALESDPAIGRRLLTLICGELSATQDRLVLLGRKSAIERLATFLLAMADRLRLSENTGDVVELPMPRCDIADHLGLTNETVSRTLAELQRRQIIAVPKASRIILLDRKALSDISTGEA